MNILIATNAFKNGISAIEAAEAIQKGLRRSNPAYNCECFPIGDGGDGTAKLIVEKCNGTYINIAVHDPLGRQIFTTLGFIDGGSTAIIEMADASGIRLLSDDEMAPLQASSYGTGELIKCALDKGAVKIILCMGGSATVDGGAGILSALGIKFLKSGIEISSVIPDDLLNMDNIDVSGLDKRILKTEVIVLCDVDNKLLGVSGAATVFGPQKGATAKDVEKLEAILSNFRDVAFQLTGNDMAAINYGGTAGGAAAGLSAFINAKLVNGIDYFLNVTGFKEALARCNTVITGEGSIDEQTLQGKGPFGVACLAKLARLPVIAFAGKVPLKTNFQLHQYFDVLMPIGNEPSDLQSAIRSTAENLERTAFATGILLNMVSSAPK